METNKITTAKKLIHNSGHYDVRVKYSFDENKWFLFIDKLPSIEITISAAQKLMKKHGLKFNEEKGQYIGVIVKPF